MSPAAVFPARARPTAMPGDISLENQKRARDMRPMIFSKTPVVNWSSNGNDDMMTVHVTNPPALAPLGVFEDVSRSSVSRPSASNWQREFFIENLLVRIYYTIVMIRRTGLALWELQIPVPGSLTSSFLHAPERVQQSIKHQTRRNCKS